MTRLQTKSSAPQALEALISKYEGRAPRYTSYPTAVQFTQDVNAEVYKGWLAELPAHEPVSIYAHIPFCSRLCWYCGCNTRAVNRHEPVSDYVGYLLRELSLLEPHLPGHLPANAIHLGGGTPNMLSVDELAVMFQAIRHVFKVTPDAEISAELDPANLNADWVKAAAFHGLNRASLGVQNLAPEVQAAVNRKEEFEEIAACVGWLRNAGVKSINLDLMYGLPYQTRANTLATIDKILTLRPERLALFGYAHVPWMKTHQQLIDEKALPGSAERLDQSEAAAEELVSAGYVRIGLDHFALPTDELAIAANSGQLHRNFQGYTTDAANTLIGIGASSIGSLRQGFVQNLAQELAWRAAVDRDELPIARGVAVSDDDRFRGEIIERLMCDLEVDLPEVCVKHGRSVEDLASEYERLADFEADNLLWRSEGRVVLSETGRLLVRSVCAVFDQHLAPEAQRHSRTL